MSKKKLEKLENQKPSSSIVICEYFYDETFQVQPYICRPEKLLVEIVVRCCTIYDTCRVGYPRKESGMLTENRKSGFYASYCSWTRGHQSLRELKCFNAQ